MHPGNVALILHAHHPYVRAAGRSYRGEESLHGLCARSLIPTLVALHDLHEQGALPRVALAWSPVLLEQLADPVVQKHFRFWLDDWLAQLDQTDASAAHQDEHAQAYLIRFYREWGQAIGQTFDQRFGRNLVGAIRALCEASVVEPLFSTATAVAEGQIRRSSTLRAQIEIGALSVTRWCGSHPSGFWPPALETSPELAALLAEAGATYTICAPDALGTLGAATSRLMALPHDAALAAYLDTPLLAYRGDPLYRAPAGQDGLAWQRNGLGGPDEPYDPFDALQRAREHASHFADVLAARASPATLQLVVLDAGLLGADWFEGPTWLHALVDAIATHDHLGLTLPADWLRANRPKHAVSQAQQHRRTRPAESFALTRALHNAEDRIAALVQSLPDAEGEQERVLQQAARELLLAQAGATPQAITKHLARFSQLCDLAEQPALSDADLTMLEIWEEEDNPFPFLNYRMFG